MDDNLIIKYKGFIPYVADSFSHKFNQKATLLRDYHDDTVVNENGRTNFKEPKYYSYGYLKTGTTLGTKRGWVLNLPQKGMSIEMEYHPQKFEDVNDFANPDGYIPGVVIDESTEEVVESIMINAGDYTNAIGDTDMVRVIRQGEDKKDDFEGQTIETMPKAILRTLAV